MRLLARSTDRADSRVNTSLVDRASFVVAVVASTWFALAAAWGLLGPIFAGHYGTMAGFGMAAENMLRWKIWAPVAGYVSSAPPPSLYYCHHPWGNFWITGALVALFGHHDWVLPLPAVLMSAATPPLLYGIGKQAWGKPAGAAACCGFAVLPITLGFANFHNVEVTVMFGCLLFFWGHCRLLATWRTRYLAASVCGVVVAASADWPAYLVLAVVLGWTLLRGFVLPRRWFSPISSSLYARWWVFSTCAALGLLMLWVGLFHHSGHLADWLSSASGRSGGSTLEAALARRRYWIEMSFTPLAIWLGKLALPVALLRLAVRRRDEEAYSLAMLFGATVSYVVFEQAADVHIFWPHYFGAYFALALGQLTASVGWLVEQGASLFSSRHARLLRESTTLAIASAFFLVMLPDAASMLRYARQTGGRFNEGGHFLRSEIDAGLVMRHIAARIPAGTVLEAHHSMDSSWNEIWALRAPISPAYALPTAAASSQDHAPFFALRASSISAGDQRRLVSTFHVEAYDDIWVIDRRAPHTPLDAFVFQEREPSWWQWYFYGGTRLVREIASDPWLTWDWRTHLGQTAPPPTGEPQTLEQKRILHNVAVSAGDVAKATSLRREIDAVLAPSVDGIIPLEGLELIGTRRLDGAEPRVELWMSARGPTTTDLSFGVMSKVERPNRLSLIPADPLERAVASPMPIPSTLFRPGFLYKQTVVLMHRIGVEKYWGAWANRATVTQPDWLAQPVDLVTVD